MLGPRNAYIRSDRSPLATISSIPPASGLCSSNATGVGAFSQTLISSSALLNEMPISIAAAANLGLSTVVDYEKSRRSVSASAVEAIRAALESAGVVFMGAGSTREGGPGVRLRAGMSAKTIALDDLNASNDE